MLEVKPGDTPEHGTACHFPVEEGDDLTYSQSTIAHPDTGPSLGSQASAKTSDRRSARPT